MKKILISLSVFCFGYMSAQFQQHTISLTTNDIVYDAVTNRIYASIPSSNGENGNSIGVINLDNYTLETTIFIGSEPSVLAISDDGKYIYSGFEGSATVRRFDVAEQTADIQFALGNDDFLGPFYAADIEVVPGNANALAVSRKYTGVTPEFAGVAVYDDGIVRPDVVEWAGGEISNRIEFKNSSVLFGYNHETTGFDFNRMAVNAGGVSLVSNTGNMPDGFSFFMDFIYHDNHAYFTDGSVLDTTTAPFVIGEFANAKGPVAYDTVEDYVCYGHSSNGVITFKRFNPETFLVHDSLALTDAFGETKSIITCGEGCYALNTTDNNVVIIKESVAGINKNKSSVVSVYPNPTTDFINIDTQDKFAVKNAEIYTLNGSVVSQATINENKIDISSLAQGIYLIRLTDENDNIYTEKIIKI